MPRIYLYLGLLILQSALPASVFSNELPPTVKQKLQQLAIPETATGVYVQEIGASQPIISINADSAMNPASVMKLLTTYAGLELLGSVYLADHAVCQWQAD